MPHSFDNDIVNESIGAIADNCFEGENVVLCSVFKDNDSQKVEKAVAKMIERAPENTQIIRFGNILKYSNGEFDIFCPLLQTNSAHFKSAITNPFVRSLGLSSQGKAFFDEGGNKSPSLSPGEFDELKQAEEDFKEYFGNKFSELALVKKPELKFFESRIKFGAESAVKVDGSPVDANHGEIDVSALHGGGSELGQVPNPAVAANDFQPLKRARLQEAGSL
jgi:hypothetical protein